eukprot:260906-Pyramimonas_sp.AAC.1
MFEASMQKLFFCCYLGSDLVFAELYEGPSGYRFPVGAPMWPNVEARPASYRTTCSPNQFGKPLGNTWAS